MKRYNLNKDKLSMVQMDNGEFVKFDEAHDLLLLAGRLADAAMLLVGGQDPTICSIHYGADIMGLSDRARGLKEALKNYNRAILASGIDA